MAETRAREDRSVLIRVGGTVQGVGFRPFVYNLARELGLRGRVWNSSQGVLIDLEGLESSIQDFIDGLRRRAPALARVEAVEVEERGPRGFGDFRIETSRSDEGVTLIPPDVATCRECLDDVWNLRDRRFRYPFTNCTSCGPRFTIILGTPYDRERTTMASFRMCEACRREYEDPGDRRFHAQPNACPRCGPRLALLDGEGRPLEVDDPLRAAASLIREGRIVAIKGLGGFHLACNATDREAVMLLRRRKRRPDKPLAIMVPDMEWVERLCILGQEERRLLESPASPIVLMRRRPGCELPEEVAPGNRYLGLFLPYSPLHHILLREVGLPLIMTSGNVTDEPICRDNGEAIERLQKVADCFLVHDRDIRSRCDDSVMMVVEGRSISLRRSRGFVPQPVRLSVILEAGILGCGADLKNSFCLARDSWAVLGQYIGDLQGYLNARFWGEALEHMASLLSFQTEIVAHDMHPGYVSTGLARSMPASAHVAVQHHHAHVVACMAEAHLDEAIGVAFDGTGYGTEGTVWGGEFLASRLEDFERVAHLEQVPMPGGEMAIRQPWRMALSHLHSAFGGDVVDLDIPFLRSLDEVMLSKVLSLVERRVSAPMTSSMGRLFDAVSSILGLRQEVTYEGQAAVDLQMLVHPEERGAYPVVVVDGSRPWQILTGPIIRSIVEDIQEGLPNARIAARFHNTVAAIIHHVVARMAQETGVDNVVLSGGVFQNSILASAASRFLERQGLKVHLPREVPPNDQGIALGQVVVAAAKEGVLRCA
jgi:hydrogenase maturation protein HypF